VKKYITRAGFEKLREQFRRLTGVAPQSYRNTFKDRKAG